MDDFDVNAAEKLADRGAGWLECDGELAMGFEHESTQLIQGAGSFGYVDPDWQYRPSFFHQRRYRCSVCSGVLEPKVVEGEAPEYLRYLHLPRTPVTAFEHSCEGWELVEWSEITYI